MAVQKQIESIKQNDKMDIKTKQELIKPLESQIQSIESQIQQVQMDAMGKK
nr:FlxA-like family protein [Clostridium tyrobutyricum]